MKYSTGYLFRRLGLGFRDDETVKALLDVNIMHLELTNSITTDYTLNNISKVCPKLQELILAGPNCSFTATGKFCLSSMCHLSGWRGIENLGSWSDRTLPKWLHEDFSITQCVYFVAALQQFLPKMKFITFLSFKRLTEITDEVISELVWLKDLKYLNLRKCTSLTDNCGKTLRTMKLVSLDMSYTLVFMINLLQWYGIAYHLRFR